MKDDSHPQSASREEYLALFDRPPEKYSNKFPEVPAPASPIDPKILAARWFANDLRAESMPEIAADLLEAGQDTPALRRLAGEISVSRTADIAELVERACRELGALPIAKREAKIAVTRQTARQVIYGERNPWRAATYLVRLWEWEHNPSEIYQLDEVVDAIDTEPEWRPAPHSLNQELVRLFARLGSPSWTGEAL